MAFVVEMGRVFAQRSWDYRERHDRVLREQVQEAERLLQDSTTVEI